MVSQIPGQVVSRPKDEV